MANIRINDGEFSLEYAMPRSLTGDAWPIALTGPLPVDPIAPIALVADEGSADCYVTQVSPVAFALTCIEDLSAIRIDVDEVEEFVDDDPLLAGQRDALLDVALEFIDDPIGIFYGEFVLE